MSNQNQFPPLSRRDFIKAVGLATGALALNPLDLFADNSPLSSATVLPRVPRPLTLGTLLPRSTLYPGLGKNWSAGMEFYFRQSGGAPVALRADDSADLLVGIGGANVVAPSQRAWLIANDAGANVLRRDEASPNIFHNSLGYWQANAAMGNWTAQRLGRKAFVASSFYESGYDSLYAFQLGFENAGGQVAQTFVAHVPPTANDLPELIAAIRRAQPDFVYAFFSGARAVDFMRAYADAGLIDQIPLAGSAFLVDEMLLPQLGNAALGIHSGLSWSPTLPTVENQTFFAAFQKMTGRAPDAFAVLGYDTARWIAEALNQVGGDLTQSAQLRQAFRAVKFASPRGAFAIDAATQTSATPLYLRQVQARDGKLVNQVLGKLEPVSENDARIAEWRIAVRTGWTHAYLGV